MIDAGQEVVSHNIETVERLYKRVRPQARYDRSLEQIKLTKEYGKRTKSGIMVGLGEKKDEVLKTMDDMVEHGLHILTIGQYLQPTKMHIEVDGDLHGPMAMEMLSYLCNNDPIKITFKIIGAAEAIANLL